MTVKLRFNSRKQDKNNGNLACMDQQFCGVEDTDNVRALNEIRLTIADFRN